MAWARSSGRAERSGRLEVSPRETGGTDFGRWSLGRIVIACYRPKPGMEQRVVELTRTHLAVLRREDLVTDRDPIAMQAADGTVVEVFEWRSQAAIDAAHGNPEVQRLWEEYAEACEYVPIADLSEARELFSSFTPL